MSALQRRSCLAVGTMPKVVSGLCFALSSMASLLRVLRENIFERKKANGVALRKESIVQPDLLK